MDRTEKEKLECISMAFEAMRFEELLKKVSTDDTERQSKRERHDKLNTKRNISRNQAV